MILRIALAGLFLFTLTACGESGQPAAQMGVLVDSPVVNMDYRTETLEGVTSALGEYEYRPGETVTFFIGDLELPPVLATDIVTPLDLAGAEIVADPMVVNIIRLLQSLDQDGDPENGITITEAAKAAATQVDFDQSVAEFESDMAVTDVVSNGGQDDPVVELVDETAAMDHFEGQLEELRSPVGTWLADVGGVDLLMIVFFDDGTYLHAEIEPGGEDNGMEWGEYAQGESGQMMVGTIFDNNGGLGLSDFEGEGAPFMFANAFGPVLTVEIDEDGDQMIDDTLTFERVEEDGIVGAWRAIENENDLLALVFFGDGTYVHAEVDFDDQLDPSGIPDD